MPPYQVPLVNNLSGATGTAIVTSQGSVVPVVLGVEIGSRAVAGRHEDVRVALTFDPQSLLGPSQRPFGFEVRVEADPPSDKAGGIVMDGHDSMQDFADIEAEYVIDSEIGAGSWRHVSSVRVLVTVEFK